MKSDLPNRFNQYTREQLVEHGHGRVFGDEFARLPLPPMLMFDRITSITSDGGGNGL